MNSTNTKLRFPEWVSGEVVLDVNCNLHFTVVELGAADGNQARQTFDIRQAPTIYCSLNNLLARPHSQTLEIQVETVFQSRHSASILDDNIRWVNFMADRIQFIHIESDFVLQPCRRRLRSPRASPPGRPSPMLLRVNIPSIFIRECVESKITARNNARVNGYRFAYIFHSYMALRSRSGHREQLRRLKHSQQNQWYAS